MTFDNPADQAEHTKRTREAYDQLAAVWSATTDEGPFNGLLERPALRSLVPGSLAGSVVLDAGCGSGAQAQWLLDRGAEVVGIDVSPRMIEEAERVLRRARPVPGRGPGQATAAGAGVAGWHHLLPGAALCRRLERAAAVLRVGAAAGRLGRHLARSPVRAAAAGPARRLFDTELLSEIWHKGGVEVSQRFWRRPLGAVLGAFADAGFAVDRVAEPQPSDEALRLVPDDLTGIVGVPVFIVYRLWLRP